MNCKNHENEAALYRCTQCSGYFCEACTDIRRFSDAFTAYICKECGGKIEVVSDKGAVSSKKTKPAPLIKKEGPPQEKRMPVEKKPIPPTSESRPNFWLMLPTVIFFPIWGKGIWLTIINAAMFFGLWEIYRLYGMIGAFLTLIYATFFIIYCLKIIEDSIQDFNTLTNFPNMHYWPSVTTTFIYVTTSLLISLAPAHIYLFMAHNLDLVYFILLGVGLFFIPMLLLRAILIKNINSLNPFSLVGSIFKAFPAYGAVCVLLVGLLYSYAYLNMEYIARMGNFEVILRAALLVYIVFIQMRILGLFVRLYRFRIAENT